MKFECSITVVQRAGVKNDLCAQVEEVGKKLSAVEAKRVRQAADD